MNIYQSKTGSIHKPPWVINKGFFATLLILCSVFCYSQKIEGTIRYIRTENYIRKLEAVDYLSKQMIEKYSYTAENKEYKTYAILFVNANQSKYEDTGENPDKNIWWSFEKSNYIITRNYVNNTCKDIIALLGKTYVIEDSLRMPKWKILNEMKEIAGHVSMNASLNDTVKKQKVIAWFALDIKNGGGPERFYGLPGLILEVNINNGAMIISADKIELKKLTTELNMPKKINGKKINENEYNKIVSKYYAKMRKLEQPPFGIR